MKNIIKEHCSLSIAGRVTGLSFQNISACCRGVQKTSGGFMWKYKYT